MERTVFHLDGIAARFVALALLWGASFLFIKVALDGLSPGQIMMARLVLGATFLAVVMKVTKRRWPREPSVVLALLLISVFACVLPFLLYAWAGQFLPSGLSSIYNATAPLATLLVSLLVIPEEKLVGGRIGGLAIGAIGVVVLATPWNAFTDAGGHLAPLAHLACLSANLCYGVAFTLSRKLLKSGRYDATTIAAGQIGIAAVLGLLLAPFVGGLEPVRLTIPIIASMALLGFLGTGIAYIWHTDIIAMWGAAPAATVTYAVPMVGVVLGILLLGERLHWNEPLGGLLILGGLLMTQGRFTGRLRSYRNNPLSKE
ncbi:MULTISPECIES: DMT family transporter [unclassified Rhizobium]|uniref:DMT family transporter n=1 Tax=unclassified Rhizobium TaxID=2613769 RepID=UPI001ADC533C|nr:MULTISPECIES: DMT family transporter [unclassified Rhizobium]MBO9123736.1 DMT family transporter [Rhizobium sp. 16-488-2b]MBO9174268.1 DMT family transporter [Rhizobium sp. 16-488-2a]